MLLKHSTVYGRHLDAAGGGIGLGWVLDVQIPALTLSHSQPRPRHWDSRNLCLSDPV